MDKNTFAILCILFNNIGVPCFIQGRIKAGILRIVLNIVTLGVIGLINFIMGVLLGIDILKMSDEEYESQKDTLAKGIPA